MSLIKTDKRNYIVYCHVFPNNKKYFGITGQKPKERWGKGGINYKGQHVYNAIKKHGWYNTRHYILFKDLTEEEAKEKEIELISQYNTTNKEYGYNVSRGGDIAVCGADNYMSIKIICINTGEIFDCINDACRAYNLCNRCVSACCKGTRHTTGNHPDTGERLVWQFYNEWLIQPKEYNNAIRNRNEQRIICIETGVIYNSITDAANSINVHRTNISRVCRGVQNTAGGYHWKYIE